MPPSSGISVRGERVGIVDWSDTGFTDETLLARIDEVLPKLFEKLKADSGNAECSVNLAGNRLRGPEPINSLLCKLREAKVQVITLRLHKNQLSDDAMKAVVDHMKATTKEGRPLLELHLSDNKLTEAGVRSLVEAAHGCRYYFSANSTQDRRCRALWLRCENQRPALTDPHGLLEGLAKEGFPVCLLPSKEFQPPSGGKGRASQMEAPVHMHHAFAPRMSEHRGSESWAKEESKGSSGKSSSRQKDQGEWWSSEGGSSDKKGKGGKEGKEGKDSKEKDAYEKPSSKGTRENVSYSAAAKGASQENGYTKSARSGSYEDSKGSVYGGAGSGKGGSHQKDSQGDWWPSEARRGPGKDGGASHAQTSSGKGGTRDRASYSAIAKGSSAENGQAKSRTFANYEDHKGKGKAIAESWRNADNYSQKKSRGTDDSAEWRDWYDDEWDDAPGGDGSQSRGQSNAWTTERPKAKLGKAYAEPESQDAPPRSAWVARHAPVPLAAAPPGQPQQPTGQGSAPFSNYPLAVGQSAGFAGPGVGSHAQSSTSSWWDAAASVWLNAASESVKTKVKACKSLGLLSRSLNPTVGSEADWQAVANLGARSIAQQCTQRASVMVGSFVEEPLIFELSNQCAGEYGLGAVFRQLRLASLFPHATLQDEQNDAQCASLLAAVFGELIDAPLAGESTHKENARKVAEWAMLDFVFLMGSSRLTGSGLMGKGNAGLARPTIGDRF